MHACRVLRAGFIMLVAVIGGSAIIPGSEKPHHTGTKLEGYATIVTPTSITVFDKKNQDVEIQTDKDYSSLIGIATPVTLWYTTKDGVKHLEDIEYEARKETFLPADLIRRNIRRIIILPRVEDVDNADGLISAISQYLADYSGWYVAPAALATEIASRNQTLTSPMENIDPATGDFDMQRYVEAQGELMAKVAKISHSDAVLLVKVTKEKATVRSSVATWDGTSEQVGSRKAHALTPWEGGKGWVYAATADMSLWGERGRLLWKNRKGFATLGVQAGFGGKYRERPLTEVYKDDAVMRLWLSSALGELARPGMAVPATTPQVSPQLKEQLEKAKHAGEEPQ